MNLKQAAEAIKAHALNTIVFSTNGYGDFTVNGHDALVVQRIIGLPKSDIRGKGDDAVLTVPANKRDEYISKLLRAGKQVEIL